MIPMTTPANGRRVLIAEDVAPSAELVRLVLEAGGYEADVVENGVCAVEAVAGASYDLVLMDIEMPEMDGYAASRAIRDLPSDRARVPVLALTASCVGDEAERCRQAGMDGYLTKPFAPMALLRAVAPWVEKAEQYGTVSRSRATEIWDRSIYNGLANRLGPARMKTALGMFEEHLVRSLSVIGAASQEFGVLTGEAHSLVSISGMLGFVELSQASRRLMTARTAAYAEAIVPDLLSSGKRVISFLQDYPKSFLQK